ncbi:MAG: hypothetical protein WCK77_13165 [Verrucomicrobiota bacterium]
MTRKKRRRSSIVEIGAGPARVKIYTINRKNGYSEFVLAWKEGGRRKVRSLSCMEEARLIAQQTTVRLTNGYCGDEATKRDIDLLRHCEGLAKQFDATLAAAMDEWASARKIAGDIALSDAVRFYQANRADIVQMKSLAQVADEFVASRRASGVTAAYVTSSKDYLKRFTGQVRGNTRIFDGGKAWQKIVSLGFKVTKAAACPPSIQHHFRSWLDIHSTTLNAEFNEAEILIEGQ